MPTPDDDESPARNDRVLFGGLAGLCAAVIIQVIDKAPSLDSWLGVGVFLQAVALPLLVGSLLREMNAGPVRRHSAAHFLYDLAGVGGAVLGFALLFVHLSPYLGLAFILASAVAVVMVVRSSQ